MKYYQPQIHINTGDLKTLKSTGTSCKIEFFIQNTEFFMKFNLL